MSSPEAVSEPKRTQRTAAPGRNQADPATLDTGELTMRAQVDPHRLAPRDVLVLQRMVGNQAVASLLGRNQSVPAAGGLRPVVQRPHAAPAIQRDGFFDRFRKSKSKGKSTKSLPPEPESAPVQNNSPKAQPLLYLDLVTKTLSRARGSLSLSETVRGATGHSWLEIQLGPQYADMDTMEADPNAAEVVEAMDEATRRQIQASPNRTTSVGFYPDVNHLAPLNILRQFYKRLPGSTLQPEQDHFHGSGTAAMRFAITTPEQALRLFSYIEQQGAAGYQFLTHNCTHWALNAIRAAGFTPPKEVKELGLVTSPNKLYRRIYEALELGDSNARVRDLQESDIAKKRSHLNRKDQAKLDAKKKELLAQPDMNRGKSPKLPMRPDNEQSTLLPVYFPANTKISVNEGYLDEKEWKSYTVNEDMPMNIVLYRGWETRYRLVVGKVQKETRVTAHEGSETRPQHFQEGRVLKMAATTVAFASRRQKSSDVIVPKEEGSSKPENEAKQDEPQQDTAPDQEEISYSNGRGQNNAPPSAPLPKSGSELQIDKGNKDPKGGRFKYNDVLTLDHRYEYEELSGKESARIRQQKNHPLHNKLPNGPTSAAHQKLEALNQDLRDDKMSFVKYSKRLEELDIDPDEVDNYRVTRLTTDDERAQYEVTGGGTQLLHGDPPKPFDTFDPAQKFHSMFLGANAAIYVMDRNGRLYAGGHKAGRFHHSSFLEGSQLAGVAPTEVSGAGEMKVSAGKLVQITNKSGHYLPTPAHLVQVLHELQGRGVPLHGVTLDLVTGTGAAQNIPGGAAQFLKDFTSKQTQSVAPPAKSSKGKSGLGYTPDLPYGTQKQQSSAPQNQGSSKSGQYTLNDQQGAPHSPSMSSDDEPSSYKLDQDAPSVPKTGTRPSSYTLNKEEESTPVDSGSSSFYRLNN